jgi:hypothetical protein
MSNGNGYAPGVYIDQVVIDTICTPIPSAVCLLGAGMVGLVGLRRKFKN